MRRYEMPVRSVWSSTHWAQESCVGPAFWLSFRALVVGTRARAHRTRKGVRGSTPLPRQISSCCMALRRVITTKSQPRASFTHFALDEKRTPNQIGGMDFDSDDQVIIPDDRLQEELETRGPWFRAFRLPGQSRARRRERGAKGRALDRRRSTAWPHGSLGANHAATRFYGAAHRLVVEL